jgi:hypothetical protein
MKRMIAAVLAGLVLEVLGAQEPAGRAVVREVSGTVEIKAPGGTEWVPAAAGQRIEKRTVISTGFRSTALIAVGNSVLTVRPLTRLSLEEILETAGNEQVGVYLQTGRVRADVNPPSGGTVDFQVRSPIITASIRGTSFEFDGERLRVDEGTVHVSGGDATGVYVGQGHAVLSVAETGRTSTVAEAAREALIPALPSGMKSTAETLAAPSAASLPVTGDMDVGTVWDSN